MDRQTALSTIRLLSLFLHESGIPIPRDRSTDNELSPLNNMFTLLNIGSSSSLIVTVTGQISPDEFLVTVVISSNSSACISESLVSISSDSRIILVMQPTISETMALQLVDSLKAQLMDQYAYNQPEDQGKLITQWIENYCNQGSAISSACRGRVDGIAEDGEGGKT